MGGRILVAGLTAIGAANAAVTGARYGTRVPGVPPDPPAAVDGILTGAFWLVALVAGIHVIRRFSTQDPPPHSETRLIGWLLVAVHLVVAVADVAGAVESSAATRDVPIAHHAAGALVGAALVLSAAWLAERERRRRPQTG